MPRPLSLILNVNTDTPWFTQQLPQSPVNKPDTRFGLTENLAIAPDGNPLLQTDEDVIAQTVKLAPDPDKSINVGLGLKRPEVRDIVGTEISRSFL